MKLPNNVESEKVVIAHLLKNNRESQDVLLDYEESIFFDEAHKAIFGEILSKLRTGEDYDRLSIVSNLEKNKHFRNVGGASYLNELANTYSEFSFSSHFKNIKTDFFLRSKMELYLKAQSAIVENKENLGARLQEYEFQMLELNQKFEDNRRVLELSGETTNEVIANLDKVLNKTTKYPGLTFGFQGIDEMTTGMYAGDSIVVAARPACGKSAFASSVIEHHLLLNPDKVIALFNLEMTRVQILQRLIASIGYIPLGHIRAGTMSHYEWARFLYAIDVIKNSKLYIDESSSLTTAALENKSRNLKLKEKRLDLVVVDYSQLMTSLQKSGNREQEVSQINRGLKLAAKNLSVPVLSLSQLSRAPEKRIDHRPMLSDLRDSGSSEQDADSVIFLYRDEQYTPTQENRGLAEAIISKQRNGPTGTVELGFIAPMAKYINLNVRKN
jgi:replicative DNA helicase